MVLIRKADPADGSSIVDFQIKMALETEKLVLIPETVKAGVAGVFKDPSRGQYYVAEESGRIIASLLITPEWSDWRDCYVWWLQSVYVMPGFRRLGIFRKMYTFIKSLAGEKDIAGLRLYAETGNTSARKTYEALGMSSEHYSFYEWMRK
ncbi:MAG: GNAT family N-acetyltransferase [Bacteroidales bacterium]|jgi:GNAT superfamily N-acetyltransferase